MTPLEIKIEQETGGVIPTPEQVAAWDAKSQVENPKGAWNASTNTPNAVATLTMLGDTLDVTVAGTSSVTGTSIAYAVGDKLKKTTAGLIRIPFLISLLDGQVTPEKTTFAGVYTQDGNMYFTDGQGNVGLVLTSTGVLKVYKIEVLQTIIKGGIEFDVSNFLTSGDSAYNFLKSSVNALTNGSEFLVTDANGFIGLKLDSAGLFTVLKATMQSLVMGNSVVADNADFLLAGVDANSAIGFAITKFSELLIKTVTAQLVTAKSLVVTESVSLPASFSIADKLAFVYGKPTDWLHMLSFGQSNSIGGGLAQTVTTVQKYDALMPKGGAFVGVGGDYSDVIPFVSVGTETPLPGLLEKFTELIADQNFLLSANKAFQIIATAPGLGSTAIAGLSKGTAPYTKLIDNVTQIKALATTKNKSYSVPVVFWTQGESDTDTTSYATYLASLTQLITDLNTDIPAITGQKNSVLVCGYQLSYDTSTNRDTNRISKAQLDLSNSNALYVVACPAYQFDYDISTGTVHFMPAHRRVLGAYYAIAAKKSLINGSKFKPLQPVKINVSGNTLLITYHVPSGPLVLDTALVPDPGNYGYKVFAAGGAALTLSNIKVISPNVISIDCSASPAGGIVTYARALTGDPSFNNADGVSRKIPGRGCLRDSQGDTNVFDGFPLHNWAVASYLSI